MNRCDFIDGQLGAYRLQQLLGQGDATEVYVAEHVEQQRQVAIKLMYDEWAEEKAERFLAQSSMLTNLHHPHIVPVLDFGIEQNVAYLVMEYMLYGNLRQRHPRGARLPLELIVQYARQIAGALTYIHERGLVHRDVKPHNMLLNGEDEIKLSDFGITIVSHSISPIRGSSRSFEGTAPYAAPEQLQGQSRRASDQYALAITIYEWLTGDWPFSGTFYEITHQHLFVTPTSLQEKGVACPPNVEKVIMRALEKEPEKRFPSIKYFADELEWAYKVAQAKELITSSAVSTVSVEPSAQIDRNQFKSPLPFRPISPV
ncbi:MAG: serine/threonine protein kinase [Ktedonobacteraceae bacterium]|nr:serine/threonine protein kinase [Ktedonobacteraceae bacterium]